MDSVYFPGSVASVQMVVYPLTILISLPVVTPGLVSVSSLAGDISLIDVNSTLVIKNTVDAPRIEYTFTLTNDTSVDMLEFYASPQTAIDWEKDILGGETVEANGDWTMITLTDERGCIYDFLAVFADGDKLEKYGINVCELETHTYYES